jgi:adenylate kinase
MIVFMGVAGAGKSVQGKLLADDLGYEWLSTGAYLREHMTDVQREEMLQGKLLADEEIIGILKNFFEELGTDRQCVLDGFPRTLPQAQWLLDEYRTGKIKLNAIVYLKVSKEVVKERLLARGRSDDTEEAIDRRFKEYEAETLPIVSWFKDQGIPVCEVNGERPIEEIHTDIVSLLKAGQ